jgi:hypothetical protein
MFVYRIFRLLRQSSLLPPSHNSRAMFHYRNQVRLCRRRCKARRRRACAAGANCLARGLCCCVTPAPQLEAGSSRKRLLDAVRNRGLPPSAAGGRMLASAKKTIAAQKTGGAGT